MSKYSQMNFQGFFSQSVVAVRLGAKSVIEEAMKRFLNAANLINFNESKLNGEKSYFSYRRYLTLVFRLDANIFQRNFYNFLIILIVCKSFLKNFC